MLQNSSEFNSVGGGYGYGGFGGGFGGIAPVGLIGLNNLFNQDRDRKGCDGDNVNAPLFIQKSIYDAKDSLNEAIDSVRDNMDGRLDSLKDALTARVENVGDRVTAEGRNTDNKICDAEKTNLQQFYQAALQAQANTTSIKDQATQFFIANDNRFDALAAAGVTQTAAILARINEAEVQSLRDQLNHSHRRNDAKEVEIQINNSAVATQAQLQAQNQFQIQRDLDNYRRKSQDREIEINNINTNTNVQAQLQAQAQAQSARDFQHTRILDALVSQNQKVGQDIVNIGGLVAANQTSTPTNVNSKQ